MIRSPLIPIRNGIPERGTDNRHRKVAYYKALRLHMRVLPIAVIRDLEDRFELGVRIQDELRRRRSVLPTRTEALALINQHTRKQRATAAYIKDALRAVSAPAREREGGAP